MAKTNKIGVQIYGYAVCLVAVITFLIAITSVVNAVFDLRDPLHSGWNQPGSPSLASFEHYKKDVLKSVPKSDASGAAYLPDEQTMRSMYAVAKSDKIQTVEHQANRTLTIGGLLIVICAVLFLTHWSWMKRATGIVVVQESDLSYQD